MASCSYCNTTILFGGTTEGNLRFCSDGCRGNSILAREAGRLPAEWVRGQTQAVHAGNCPECGGHGPVDVHTAHRVFSAVFLTSWSSHPKISCRKCAIKRQLGSMLYCLVLGWWGIPWGLIWTPVQTVRNLVALVSAPAPDKPSALLERMVAFDLAAQQLQKRQGAPGVPPPLPPVVPGGS